MRMAERNRFVSWVRTKLPQSRSVGQKRAAFPANWAGVDATEVERLSPAQCPELGDLGIPESTERNLHHARAAVVEEEEAKKSRRTNTSYD